MHRLERDGILYMECTPHAWAAEVVSKFGMKGDLACKFFNLSDLNKRELGDMCLKFHNRVVSFDLDTRFNKIKLEGCFFDILHYSEKRNMWDMVFIKKKYLGYRYMKSTAAMLNVGYLINLCAVSNIKLETNEDVIQGLKQQK